MTHIPTIVGIDLGTTYSLVSVLRDGRPEILPNALGEVLTPSAVSVDDKGIWLVGAAAKARAITHPASTIVAFKRDMGTDRTYVLGGSVYTPVQLSAMVLQELKRDAEAALGKPIDEAVITVPAYFGDKQRQATKDAAAIAGLKAERIVNEPTAAALAYGLHQRDRDMRVCVLDLGGGTFDVTVLTIADGIVEIQASAGDARLGGEDFTDAIHSWLNDAIHAQFGQTPPAKSHDAARIRDAAESAKKALGEAEEVRVAVPHLVLAGQERDFATTINRTQAASAWSALIERMRSPILRALRDAKSLPSAIDEVLLVGGATRMRPVVELATSVFHKLPNRSLPPDEAVALGAAVQAALKAGEAAVDDLIVTDVAPFSLGIETSEFAGAATIGGLYAPILERGTTIPASREKRFFTMSDNQREILVSVFQGEHSLTRDNQALGTFRLQGLPPGKAGMIGVDVRFTYDLNGILEVEMSVVGSNRKEHLVIEQRPGMLDKSAVEKARLEMKKLKFHPRESLPNRTALERADALFTQLKGQEREFLGMLLARFRAALDTQDEQLIEALRKDLQHFSAMR
jgi:molecular chaperone HscC